MNESSDDFDFEQFENKLERHRMVEAILFASHEPVTLAEISQRVPDNVNVKQVLDELIDHYGDRGMRIVQVGSGWAFRTAPDLGYLMTRERIVRRRLSNAAMETLAIIAYHQPVTRAEIEEVRGVGTSRGTLDILIERDWVGFGRRRNTPGRPATYVITESFLDHFGLASIDDLPGLKELREAGLLELAPE